MAAVLQTSSWSRLNGFLLLLLVGLIFYCSWLNNKIVTRSYKLNDLRQEEKQLIEERDKLQAELATLQRPQNLMHLGKLLGLKEPKSGQKIILP
ncbi:MAG: hypothetical protein JXR89_04485 [Deltaproteobacteria bacterium]|nr:hypothetical protein [Deltaproteobacteria bacterium]